MAPDLELFNVGTMGEMASRISRWARERLDRDTVYDAINDALESLWQSVSVASLSRFTTGPISQTVLAGTTTLPIVSVSNPVAYLTPGSTPGGGLPDREYTLGFTLVTDSGSQTAVSPQIVYPIPAGSLAFIPAPDPSTDDCLGWNLFAGVAGRMVQQNVAPLPFLVPWLESPTGISRSPNGPFPPAYNNTADNIQAIRRISALNVSGTRSRWRQGDVASLLFSDMERRTPTTSSYSARAYDLLDNRTVEIRPAGDMDLPLDVYYVVRPRRLRFPASRLPFTSMGVQGFLRHECLADILLSLGESSEAEARSAKAERERQRITLAVLGENWDKNTLVRPFRAGR